jgi:hypothetical protein
VVVQLPRLFRHIREEHELLSLLVPVLALAAIGSADIWRYIAYGLPGAAILFAVALRDVAAPTWVLVPVTVFTVITQRPWRAMNDDLYFSDWFPYYAWLSHEPPSSATVRTWAIRGMVVAAGLLFLRAAAVGARSRADAAVGYHVRR